MNFKFYTRELQKANLISNEQKIENEEQLYEALFLQERTAEGAWLALGNFIVNGMSETEFMEFILSELHIEHIYKAVAASDRIVEFMWRIVFYYGTKVYWEFYDYENVIAFLFRFSENMTAEELEINSWFKIGMIYNEEAEDFIESDEDYLSCLRIGLVYAGEERERGKAFRGGEMIRKYTPYLDVSIVRKIFENMEKPDGGGRLDWRYQFQMIELCRTDDLKIRKYMRFQYVYYCYLVNRFTFYFNSFFAGDENGVYGNVPDELKKKYIEVLCYKKSDLGKMNLFAVKKHNDDSVVFEVICNNRMINFSITLNDEKKIVYKNFKTEKKYDEIWSDIVEVVPQVENINDIPIHNAFKNISDDMIDDLKKQLDEKVMQMGNIRLEILYVYVKSIYGRPFDKELPFSDEYIYELKKEELIHLHMTPQMIRGTSKNFFTNEAVISDKGEERGRITSINALIGKNGSGKTSITKVLMESEIFGDVFSQKGNVEAEYCMVYRVGETLYYSYKVNENRHIEVTCDEGTVHLFQNTEYDREIYRNMFNTTVVMYHNIINPLDMDVLFGGINPISSVDRKDLSTTYILAHEYRMTMYQDIVRIMNFMADVEDFEMQNSKNFFKEFDLREIREIKQIVSGIEEKKDRKEFPQMYNEFLHMELEERKKVKFLIDNLSTGECARLLLFARLHSIFHTNDNYLGFIYTDERFGIFDDWNRGNYLLLLDEIEAFFHPTWQRTIVYDLVAFLEWEERTFAAYDNVHLILSSNSPFFLSDLPKTKLVRLDKGNKWEGRKQSFGENIHTILKNSFLKDDGLMGKFAQNKIERAFSFLRKEELNKEEWEYVDEIMNLVEEPILKYALKELYDAALEKINDKQRKWEIYNKQLESIQKKMKELEEV